MKSLLLLPVAFIDFQPHGTHANAMFACKTSYFEWTRLVRRRLHECSIFTLPRNDLYHWTEALQIFVKARIFPLTFRGLSKGVTVNGYSHETNLFR